MSLAVGLSLSFYDKDDAQITYLIRRHPFIGTNFQVSMEVCSWKPKNYSYSNAVKFFLFIKSSQFKFIVELKIVFSLTI